MIKRKKNIQHFSLGFPQNVAALSTKPGDSQFLTLFRFFFPFFSPAEFKYGNAKNIYETNCKAKLLYHAQTEYFNIL